MSEDELWKQFNEIVRESIVKIEFTKVGGLNRVMRCTLVPEYYKKYKFKTGNTLEQSMIIDIVAVWDVESKDWRIVKKDSLISVEEV